MTTLRPSQIETLKAVAELQDEAGEATAVQVAKRLGRPPRSTESSLLRLVGWGYLQSELHLPDPLASTLYALTQPGREALREKLSATPSETKEQE